MVKFREAIKGMSTKEKIDYIWEYYKLVIFGFIFLIAFVWLVADSIINQDPDPIGLTIISESSLTQVDELKNDFDSLNTSPHPLLFDHFYHQGGIIEDQALQMLERLATTIGVGQVDLLISPLPFAEQLIEEEILIPFDDQQLINQLNNLAIELLLIESDVYGISTSSNHVLTQYDGFTDSYIFLVASGRQHEEAITLIEQLIQE
ncbi:hypothetical protein SAMN04488134_108151 [Amphibacillus marinus]|uniref:Uncharacterized protein n=1 Tax=Amphibacillus marinus TaxID=872970 RepID=A0A1H8QFI3_9BACI|nr:hypothetical protein [Amphibacillus marinus]SEO52972.1 hypothetical protein SAMN04488134_108151 [Amphibacillus marinus]